MDESLLAQVRTAKIAALGLSRAIPTRACSPYGGLDTDKRTITTIARMAFEALHAVEQAMLPDTRKTAQRQITFVVDPVQLAGRLSYGDMGQLGALLVAALQADQDIADRVLTIYGVTVIR